MNERGVRIAVIVVNLFEAASAIVGAVGLIVGYTNVPVTVLSGTLFTDFTVPALLLGFVVGGSALVAAAIVAFGPRRFDALAAAAAGCVTVGWITAEVAMIGLDVWVQVAYFIVGVLMIGMAGLLQWTKSHQRGVTASRHPA